MPSPPTYSATTVFSPTSEIDIAEAAAALRDGHLLAFPTETVYGLGANALTPSAVSAIFRAKGRPSDNPLIVHVSSLSDLTRWPLTPLPLSPAAARLAKAFWPGPLTLVLPLAARSPLAAAVTAGLRSVALRVPKHPVAAALLAKAAVPVAAPSANRSGRPSPTSAAHVIRDLDGAVFGVVDAGDLALDDANCGVESTVVDMTDPHNPSVLRPGAVSVRELERVSGVPFREVERGQAVERPKAPGMKYRHYAPVAPMTIVERTRMKERLEEERRKGKLVGVLANDAVCEQLREVSGVVTVNCGREGDVASFARELYGALRAFDGEGKGRMEKVAIILAVPPPDTGDGIGAAVMNRLVKASAGSVESIPESLKSSH